MMRELLKQTIKSPAGEGSGPMIHGRLMPYFDCCGKPFRLCTCATQGKLTVGYGLNIEDEGLTMKTADAVLDEKIDAALADLKVAFPWIETLDAVRLAVLTEMCFNLGITRLRRFVQFLKALKAGDYDTAAVEMLASTWAEQVGRRARRLAESMRTGVWQSK